MRSIVGRYSGRRETGTADVRLAFASFKKIMDDNNRALEIMADMGETMSGGFLFDIVYIRRTYADLAASVRTSIKDFNQLTARRYPELESAFNKINTEVESLISGTARPAERLAIRFKDITPEDARDVGGKSFHLAEIKNRIGLPAPEGFALTVFAFEEYIRHNHLGDIIARLHGEGDDPALRRLLREKIIAGSLPPALEEELAKGLAWLRGRCGECRLAVRSSAEEEDGIFSFAGQFETVLNVPAEFKDVRDAYRQVLASVFSDEAAAYQERLGYGAASLRMAVGFVAMVDAVASGVTYTADPLGGKTDVIIVNSAWGLGKSVVEGSTDADQFVLGKAAPYPVVERTLGKKEKMTAALPGGGVEEIGDATDRRSTFSLSPEVLNEIARQVIAVENYYHRPQDIEWAVDAKGRVTILQARPLRVREKAAGKAAEGEVDASAAKTDAAVAVARPERLPLMQNRGSVVQPGAVAGKVFFASSPEALDDFPRDAILVARNDSPQFARVMPYAAAIITDSGNTTGHMASISREFRVPTVVNAGIATETLKAGSEITLQADDDGGMAVYDGIVREIIDEQHDNFLELEELYEFRRRRYIMKFITPLNLVNPFTDEFSPQNCRTVHDVLRFIHEKSMRELIESSRHADRSPSLKRLDIDFMDDIHVINIGSGLAAEAGNVITLDQLACVPLKAVLRGMSYPGAWRKGGVPISISDFFTASLRTGTMLENIDMNLAVISHFYLNLSVRFGYHYSVVDCYCSEQAGNNHVYFRFMGGAADISKRMRRIELLRIILDHLGLISRSKGDMITGTITNISQDETVRILDQLGRLMAFTRQLDAMLTGDRVVEDYARRFIHGDYELF